MNNIPTTNIRIAEEADAHAIATIHVASWQKIYQGHIPDTILKNLSINEREQKWRELINNHVKILIIERNNLAVGFASIGPSRDTDSDPTKCGEISAIYFHPDFWRQGLGRKLCNKAFSELEEMGFSEVTVWVLKDNALARRFYESIGFDDTGDIKADKYDENVILNEVRYRRKLTNLVNNQS
jgi:ribosomal protein S18 acetylase RimI-like enzyme